MSKQVETGQLRRCWHVWSIDQNAWQPRTTTSRSASSWLSTSGRGSRASFGGWPRRHQQRTPYLLQAMHCHVDAPFCKLTSILSVAIYVLCFSCWPVCLTGTRSFCGCLWLLVLPPCMCALGSSPTCGVQMMMCCMHARSIYACWPCCVAVATTTISGS